MNSNSISIDFSKPVPAAKTGKCPKTAGVYMILRKVPGTVHRKSDVILKNSLITLCIGWDQDVSEGIRKELEQLKTADDSLIVSWAECDFSEKYLRLIASAIGTALGFPNATPFCDDDFGEDFINLNVFIENDFIPHFLVMIYLDHGKRDEPPATIELLRGHEVVYCSTPVPTAAKPWATSIAVTIHPLNTNSVKAEITETPELFSFLTDTLGCFEKNRRWSTEKIGENCWRFQNW